MKNKSTSLTLHLAPTRSLLIIALALIPVTGHCDIFSPITKMFGSKGKDSKEVATKISTLKESGEVSGLDFSPDGKYLAVTSPETVAPWSQKIEVHVWDWQGGRIVQTLEKVRGANDGLTTEPIRYSPDGHLLVACHSRADNNIVARIWNTDTWEVAHDIVDPIPGSGCNAIGFTPDGKSLIRVLDRIPAFPQDILFVYDTQTWQLAWRVQADFFHPYALAISPEGKFFALGGESFESGSKEHQIAIVDMAQRKIVRTIPNMLSYPMSRLAWSPNADHIALGGPNGIEIFNAYNSERVKNEATDGRHVLVRYTSDGKYLIESGFGKGGASVKIWDGEHRELLQEIRAMPDSMAISRDGHYLAMSGDRKIVVWELK